MFPSSTQRPKSSCTSASNVFLRAVYLVPCASFSAAAAGGFIDKLVESKGLDFIDKEKAKYEGEFALLSTTRFCDLTRLRLQPRGSSTTPTTTTVVNSKRLTNGTMYYHLYILGHRTIPE